MEYVCEKCDFKTNLKQVFYKHMNFDKSCNEEYDNEILILASNKIKTINNSNITYEITYSQPDYELYIKKSETDFYIKFEKSNGVHVGFFAEINQNGELVIS